jgi:hypothetical protein
VLNNLVANLEPALAEGFHPLLQDRRVTSIVARHRRARLVFEVEKDGTTIIRAKIGASDLQPGL